MKLFINVKLNKIVYLEFDVELTATFFYIHTIIMQRCFYSFNDKESSINNYCNRDL